MPVNNFKIIYKILRLLDKYKGDESFDVSLVSAQAMGVSFPEWEQLIIEIFRAGYIDGITTTQTMSDKFPHIVEPITPRITLKGMEYLSENGMMGKARDALRLLGDLT